MMNMIIDAHGGREPEDSSLKKPPSILQVVEELKELWGMAIPITPMNCVVYIRAMVSVVFLGRLGTFSNQFIVSQCRYPLSAFGSKNWDLLSLSLQQTILILLTASIPISILWINLQSIMIFLGQDASITSMAAIYCIYSLPDLLTNTLLQPLRVYLRSQRITKPMMCCSVIAVLFHVPLNMLLMVMKLGVPGVAMASVLTNLNTVVLMSGYIYISGRCKLKWTFGVKNVISGLGPLLKLAIPSCLGICLEWWWYEIMIVLACYLPDPTIAVAASAILIQTTSLMYTVPMALAACAKLAALVALGFAFIIGIMNVTWTAILRERWAGLFTKDELVGVLVAAVMPIMGLCELGNCPQTTGCGVLRGTARPAVGARINLGSFYCIGTPVAVGLAFWLNIGFSGLWYGLLSAQAACVISILFVILLRTDWEAEALRARKLTSVEVTMNGTCHSGSGDDHEKEGLLNVEKGRKGLERQRLCG
ncbi:hypothetical protein MKX01_027315 [Papaver californicum]|nr:hypothetical protein MKX01_027315 [Papaver californicum]